MTSYVPEILLMLHVELQLPEARSHTACNFINLLSSCAYSGLLPARLQVQQVFAQLPDIRWLCAVAQAIASTDGAVQADQQRHWQDLQHIAELKLGWQTMVQEAVSAFKVCTGLQLRALHYICMRCLKVQRPCM